MNKTKFNVNAFSVADISKIANVNNITGVFTELQSISKADYGDFGALKIQESAMAVSGLSGELQTSSLLMNGFTEAETSAILSTNGLTDSEIEQALAFAQSGESIKLYNAEVIKAGLQNSVLSSTEQKLVLDKLGLIDATTGELVASKEVSQAKLQEALMNIGLEESEAAVTAERIISTITQGTQKASMEAIIALTKKQIIENAKYIANMVAAHPVATALGVALTALGAAILYNKHQEEEYQEALKESVSTMSTATSEYSQSASTLDELTAKYKSLKKQLDNTNLSESEAYQIKSDLYDVQCDLIDNFGNEAKGIDLVNGEYREQLGLLQQINKEAAEAYLTKNKEDYDKNISYLTDKEDFRSEYTSDWSSKNSGDMSDDLKNILEANGLTIDAETWRSELGGAWTKYYVEFSDMTREEAYNMAMKLGETLRQAGEENADLSEDPYYDLVQSYLSYVTTDLIDETELNSAKENADYYEKLSAMYSSSFGELYNSFVDARDEYLNALQTGKGIEEAKLNFDTIYGNFSNSSKAKSDEITNAFEDVKNSIDEELVKLNNWEKSLSGSNELNILSDLKVTDDQLRGINWDDEFTSPAEDAFGNLLTYLGASREDIEQVIGLLIKMGAVIGEVQDSKSNNKTNNPFLDVWNSTDFVDTKEKLLDLAKSGEFTPEILESTEEYATFLSQTSLSAEEAKNKILDMLSAQEKLASISNGLGQLVSSYEEFQNLGYVTASTLELLPDAFKKLSGFDLFSEIAGDPTQGTEKIQQAFNNIVKEYLISQNTLSGLVNASDSKIQSCIANLKHMNITNAEEVVNQTVKILSQENQLLNDAETEYMKYLENKDTADIAYLENLNTKNEQLTNTLGSPYQTDYNNWLELLQKKSEAYNNFVNAIKSSQSSALTSEPLSAYGQAKKILQESKGKTPKSDIPNILNSLGQASGTVSAYTQEQIKWANEYVSSYEDAEKQKNLLKLDLSTINTDFGTPLSFGTPSSNSSTQTAETFNFIETAITRIESAIDRVKSKAGEAFNSFKSRSKSYAETISKITDEINLQEQARQKYIERRDSVGLDEYWAAQVRDGSLNIVDVTDDNLKQKIKDYEEWNDKIIECTESISDLKKDQKELVQESIELLITKYEKLAAKVSNSIESIQNKIDLKEAWGGSAGISDYRSMNKGLAKQIGYIQNQNTELKKLQKTVTNGSEAWYDYQEQIDSNNASVQNLTKSMAENAQASAALSKANADKKAKKYDSRDELNDAKIDNATTAKSKNSLINKKMSNINGRQRAYDNAVTASTNRLNASISSINSLKSKKTNTKNKTTNKENKTYNTVLKKVKAQIKAGKRIGVNLLSDTTALNDNLALYNACVQYNANLDAKADNETIAEIYAETAKQEKADLALEKFNNIAAEYDYSTSANEQKKTELNNKISLAEAQGRKVNIAYYNGLISAETGEQQKLIQKRNALQKSLDNAVASGQIEKGSEEWYEMIDAINEVTNAIDDSVESVVEYQNAIRQIRWDTFDDSLETAKRIPGENDFYIDFMSKNKDLIDEDSRNFTEYGNAALALHNENYKNYLAQADAYAKEYNDIMDQVARGELSLDDENVIQRLRELQDAQRDAALSAEDELQANRDLVKQGYEAQLNALSELIQKYKDLQQSEKDAYEYQKSIAEKTKNISMLQKQLAAYGENDTEEARAKIQQIKVDLEEAKQDLKETEYEKYLSDTNDMLDEMYGDYEDFIDKRLKDTDAILETINASIGGMSSSIIATLASLNGGITPELEKLLNGSVSSSDYVNGVIASDKAKQEASMRAAEARDANEAGQKAAKEKEQADARYEAEKAKLANQAKIDDLELKIKKEEANLNGLKTARADLENTAYKILADMNEERKRKGLKPLTGLSNVPNYTKEKNALEKKIKTSQDKLDSLNKQLTSVQRKSISEFANGCSYIPYDQLAWTQEKGAEAILRKSDGALLTPLGMGDMVFDNETTHRLLETSKMIPVQLVNGMNLTPMIPALPAIERNVTGGNVSIDLGGINMYGVNDPETFGRQIREEICKNGKTLQCITEGVSSKMTGKGIGSTRLFQ